MVTKFHYFCHGNVDMSQNLCCVTFIQEIESKYVEKLTSIQYVCHAVSCAISLLAFFCMYVGMFAHKHALTSMHVCMYVYICVYILKCLWCLSHKYLIFGKPFCSFTSVITLYSLFGIHICFTFLIHANIF